MSECYRVNVVVIGSGVVGLSVARALAMENEEVWLIEQHPQFGMETSSRNSEVIHAGIYYPKNSLKAQFCVEGKHRLYQYCEERNIPFKRCGKLIVATDESHLPRLELIQQKAKDNGVDDLRLVDQAELKQLEPELFGLAALHSPSTGVVDSHAYMLSLLGDFEAAGGQFVANSQVQFVAQDGADVHVELADGICVKASKCVNSAGLFARSVLERKDSASGLDNLESFPMSALPNLRFAKGDYFSYQGRVPFSHLIYPVPEDGGLGVHLTMDLSGAAKFGPDVTWLDVRDPLLLNYDVEEDKKSAFVREIKRYWPSMDKSKLVPDYSGMRPKLSGPGEPAADFQLQTQSEHGIKGLVNLFGIESPGLTSSLALGEAVKARLALP